MGSITCTSYAFYLRMRSCLRHPYLGQTEILDQNGSCWGHGEARRYTDCHRRRDGLGRPSRLAAQEEKERLGTSRASSTPIQLRPATGLHRGTSETTY